MRMATGANVDKEISMTMKEKPRVGWICPLCGKGINPDIEYCDCNDDDCC